VTIWNVSKSQSTVCLGTQATKLPLVASHTSLLPCYLCNLVSTFMPLTSMQKGKFLLSQTIFYISAVEWQELMLLHLFVAVVFTKVQPSWTMKVTIFWTSCLIQTRFLIINTGSSSDQKEMMFLLYSCLQHSNRGAAAHPGSMLLSFVTTIWNQGREFHPSYPRPTVHKRTQRKP
jgi:hypothetical protein